MVRRRTRAKWARAKWARAKLEEALGRAQLESITDECALVMSAWVWRAEKCDSPRDLARSDETLPCSARDPAQLLNARPNLVKETSTAVVIGKSAVQTSIWPQ